ncbi:MAG: mechanosensitive ion channel family protein [Verrucomicrobia bacterium]|nr:mechanosensitive ion channel family protein [Verrucomicrobiota bacterium]
MDDFFNKLFDVLRSILDYHLFKALTVADLIKLFVLFGVVIVVERFLRRHFTLRLLKRSHFEPSLQYALGKIMGYCFLALGFYISFQMANIDLSSLAIVAGAVGVGLGFGLQNIISNFVSGLILLAERPIAIGDRVEISGVAGQVKKISLRSTTVVTNDNIAIIVPNADFITHSVTNWSYDDPRVRYRIPFGVAYGTDLKKLQGLMMEVAAEHPKALKEPKPSLFMTGFGDNSLNFELAVWSSEMTVSPRTFRSDLNFAIEQKLRENNIEIPFPQRDVHLRSGSFVSSSPSPEKS